MKPIAVMEHLNVVYDVCMGFFPGCIPFFIDTLDFESMEEALNHGIIPAVTLTAHTAGHTVLL